MSPLKRRHRSIHSRLGARPTSLRAGSRYWDRSARQDLAWEVFDSGRLQEAFAGANIDDPDQPFCSTRLGATDYQNVTVYPRITVNANGSNLGTVKVYANDTVEMVKWRIVLLNGYQTPEWVRDPELWTLASNCRKIGDGWTRYSTVYDPPRMYIEGNRVNLKYTGGAASNSAPKNGRQYAVGENPSSIRLGLYMTLSLPST